MNYPPRLETARLYTRSLTHEDAQPWTEFLAHAEATRYLPNPEGYDAHTRATHWIDRQLARYAEGSYGMTVLMHRDTDAFVGQCGLLTQMVDDVLELEVGYHIFPEYWRQGYAREAARAFRDLAFETTDTRSVISLIHPDNLGSQGVARHNGMTLEKMGRFREMSVRVYRIWRDAWTESKAL
jgi:[ribosomal protein S5]-alanine N-acetyltransferase